MANALKRVANYLGLMDDPEFDTPATVPAVPLPSDVRVKSRTPRHVSSVVETTSNEVSPQLELPVLDRIVCVFFETIQ